MNHRGDLALNPLSLRLDQSSLIEASAGTGKTFTIAQLYLRLVLGHGRDTAFGRPLQPKEILVATFTEAATRELRARLRDRLVEAAEAFSSAAAGKPYAYATDPLLRSLVSEYPDNELRAQSQLLAVAAEGFDLAAVSTLHGWCARMLREHAFDSGSLFDLELEESSATSLTHAVHDYWRRFIYPLDPVTSAVIARHWGSPDALRRQLKSLIDWESSLVDTPSPADLLSKPALATESLRMQWRSWAGEFSDVLDQARKHGQIKKSALRAHHVAGRLKALTEWANGPIQSLPIADLLRNTLSSQRIRESWLGEFPIHPALRSIAELEQLDIELAASCRQLLRHAARWCAQAIRAERIAGGRLGFHDLLTRLDAALHGPSAEQLAATIRTQFPVALVDEFQDTDPLQFRILQRIYPISDNACGGVMVMVGDPKQAIYGFRGADIYSYLKAQSLTIGRHVTLGTNYRSSAEMVAAANHLFQQAEARESTRGAFRLGGHHGLQSLRFSEVHAAGRKERWVVSGNPAPALTFWTAPHTQEHRKSSHEERIAAACATAISSLLHQGQQGHTGFRQPNGNIEVVKPSDIAILVNNAREANLVRAKLTARGVRSVFFSERDSVFNSPIAADIQRWLEACADPADERKLRAALGSTSLALDFAVLERCLNDEAYWESMLEQFLRYREQWRTSGVLPMLTTFTHNFGVAEALLARDNERDLTDLLHLAEWLQEQSATIDGEQALIRHFETQRLSEEDAQDNPPLRLRLESDDDLVKVVTVHKSKGLEYPLVFLPFAWAHRPTKESDCPIRWHDDQSILRIDTVATPEALERAENERLAEDIRKLYVAITRAQHAIWIGMVPPQRLRCSALGFILLGDGETDEPLLNRRLDELGATCPGIVSEPAPESGASDYFPITLEPEWRAPLPLPERASHPWWITSFSKLSLGAQRRDTHTDRRRPSPASLPNADEHDPAPASSVNLGTALEEIFVECTVEAMARPGDGFSASDGVAMQVADDVDAAKTADEVQALLEDFPRGAQAGSFLHGLFEWMGTQGFARCATRTKELGELIQRRADLAGYSRWVPALQTWLKRWLHTPLRIGAAAHSPIIVAPANLTSSQVELEFWLPVEGVDTSVLDALVTKHTAGAVNRPALSEQRVYGMLRGFIDLTFEHEGRYFVLDYKSNHLGNSASDYSPARLREAALEHRYDLQCVLYLFALHRLLLSRLGDRYDYDRHVGGAALLFLRGQGSETEGVHFERPPHALMTALEKLFAGKVPPGQPQHQLPLALSRD